MDMIIDMSTKLCQRRFPYAVQPGDQFRALPYEYAETASGQQEIIITGVTLRSGQLLVFQPPFPNLVTNSMLLRSCQDFE